MDLSRVDPASLDVVAHIVSELTKDGIIAAESIMLVGAECRDILHQAPGHGFGLRRTNDLDIGLAINDWQIHDDALSRFAITGDTGIRYKIAGLPVAVMPFGSIEDPRGEVVPLLRRDTPLSVFAFQEVFDKALVLPLPEGPSIRIPTAAGYAALKLRAWRDRWMAMYETKDGPDLAVIAYWYAESPEVEARLWDTPEGNVLLEGVDYEYPVAAARLMGQDACAEIGSQRADELRALWRLIDLDELSKAFGDQNIPHWPRDRIARRRIVGGLTAGLLDR